MTDLVFFTLLGALLGLLAGLSIRERRARKDTAALTHRLFAILDQNCIITRRPS